MKIIIFVYALILGSFLNVVGLRVPAKQSIVKPPSACPGCGKTLTVFELIPVLSFLLQRGKCKQCKQPISPFYPIMELATALLFVYAYSRIGWTFELVIAWTLITLFVIIFITDIKFMLIPDKILAFFAILFIVERMIQPLQPWWDSLLGAAAAFILLMLIAILSKGGMGGGDIKLYTVLGLALGTKFMLISFFFANILGAIIGIIGMACGFFERKKPIPFGPFIAMGTLITYFYHQPILTWYQSLFQ
ncbi:type 4 prepilin-like proteins leader peptide-processing enzyme [Bacillus sp. J14TS2]|uniref:prepilin peptidase n=1 Tax=Bacillus sp. J14TS2 TaxID=2807188 RepID=UPI001B094117|nr:A24 family peptidase [Bacillus sp. J14TS2]GIN71081.1 type 4 prepilin-like proteins leader peptide-processing enzyme [Bacillus sp. J14TS2]